MKVKKTSKIFLVHPILFGLYPVLTLYFFNRNEIVFSAITQSIITSFFILIIVIAISFLAFRSWQKAAILSSMTFFLFYSYGHVYSSLEKFAQFNLSIGRHRYLLLLWALIFIIGLAVLIKSKTTKGLNEILNSISLFLIAFISIQIFIFMFQSSVGRKKVSEEIITGKRDSSLTTEERDIYYILVDAYSREDLLQEKLDLDTSEFLTELRKLGFYIPDCTQSNYDTTKRSMTSTLNMDYLDEIGLDYLADKSKYLPYTKESLVFHKFENLGYSTVTFKSLFPLLDMDEADYYYDYFSEVSSMNSLAGLNFQYLFLRTTLFRPIIDAPEGLEGMNLPSFLNWWIPTDKSLDLRSRAAQQYLQNVYALEKLNETPDLPPKKFIYAHLYITHQPYVFYPDGRFHPALKQGDSAYRDQVIFINSELIEIIKTILEKSDPPPVIVLQSDHSYFEGEDRPKILNAYYFPDGGDEYLYDTITPVNTFRLIFNIYFNEQNSILPDTSLYTDLDGNPHEMPSTCVSDKP